MKKQPYNPRTGKICEKIALVLLQIYLVSTSLYFFSLSDTFISLILIRHRIIQCSLQAIRLIV